MEQYFHRIDAYVILQMDFNQFQPYILSKDFYTGIEQNGRCYAKYISIGRSYTKKRCSLDYFQKLKKN